MPYLERFEVLPDTAKIIPLRLIHEYQCLPIKREPCDDGQERIALVTVWPPDSIMERWIYAVCRKMSDWFLTTSELVTDTITQKFGVGADSLDDSGIEGFEDQREHEKREDQNAAIITFVNEVIQKALTDRATDILLNPTKTRCRYATVLTESL